MWRRSRWTLRCRVLPSGGDICDADDRIGRRCRPPLLFLSHSHRPAFATRRRRCWLLRAVGWSVGWGKESRRRCALATDRPEKLVTPALPDACSTCSRSVGRTPPRQSYEPTSCRRCARVRRQFKVVLKNALFVLFVRRVISLLRICLKLASFSSSSLTSLSYLLLRRSSAIFYLIFHYCCHLRNARRQR